jgi:hypothetical protein
MDVFMAEHGSYLLHGDGPELLFARDADQAMRLLENLLRSE